MKRLVINADDFGYTKGINKGIIHAHKHGVVTSTSIMVNRIAANDISKLSKFKNLSVGLHFDITDEKIMDYLKTYKKIALDDKKKIRKDFYSQIEKFTNLTGKLPDHLDSHLHFHMNPKIKPIFKEYSEKYSIPVRACGNFHFINKFIGWNKLRMKNAERISIESLLNILSNLKDGINEIMCHPGFVDTDLKNISSYNNEREIELKTLTDKKIKDYIKKSNIKLLSWKEIVYTS